MYGNDLQQPRGLSWTTRMSPAGHIVAIGALLVLAWLVVYTTGGTRTAWPHLFYFPIVLAAVSLGPRSGATTGVLATIACGPLMPLDAGAQISQSPANWVTRGAFFVGIAIFAGVAIDSLRGSLQRSVDDHFQHEFELATAPVPVASSDVAKRLRLAISERSFHPVYQPIYSLEDGRLLAVEALTRFDGPPDQPPDVWFDQAARAGMETELDLVTTQAALDGADAQLPAELALHLNVTPATLRDTRLLALLTSYVPHRQIVVEITEHAVIDDYQRLEMPCQRLRHHGIKIAVDDAGAGISSLRHVIKLAPEVIKLDISLTRDVRKSPIQHALARALATFASEIDALLVVEGIEEQSDLTAWTKLGAHAAQGYYLARPGPLPAPSRCPSINDVQGAGLTFKNFGRVADRELR
jgi:EAL domain-containing protein (putative c-di-GMP-specific phosphodiesterase class I)